MPKADPILDQLKKIVFALPDTKLTMTWGKPHFRVGEKIFCGYGEENGKRVVGFKLEMSHAAALCRQAGFSPAPYVGHKGWVSMDASGRIDWSALRGYLRESYRLIAPKRSLAKLSPPTSKPAVSKKPVSKKPISKKPGANKP